MNQGFPYFSKKNKIINNVEAINSLKLYNALNYLSTLSISISLISFMFLLSLLKDKLINIVI